jgi:hypothetical protein
MDKAWAQCALLLLALAISACGDSNGGGSPGLIVEPLTDQSLLSEPVRWCRSAIGLASADGGGFLLARTEVPDAQSVTVDRFDADLVRANDPSIVQGGSPHYLTGPSLCAVNGRRVLSWTDTIPGEQMPIGVNLDLGNVRAANLPDGASTTQAFQVNANVIGSQFGARVACFTDGRFAILWVSICEGLRKIDHNSYASYEPEECANEPPDGLYLQVFNEIGEPDWPMKQVLARAPGEYGFGAGAIAALPDDRMLVVAGPFVRIYDRDGEVLDEGELPNAVSDPMLSCSNQRCVAVMPLWSTVVAVVIDPDDLSRTFEREIKAAVEEINEPGRRVGIVPYEGSVSCASNGVCLVSWQLVRETWYSDYGDVESLGMYAVALDSRTGALGPEAELLDAAAMAYNDTAPISIAVGDGEFVTARVMNGAVLLGRANVR